MATGSKTTGPDFLGIGAMRSGSTWLHRNLRAHPELWLPPIKELHYFDCQVRGPRLNKFSRGHLRRRLRAYRHPRALRPASLLWDLRYFLGRRDHAWYRSLFRPARGRVAGEITPRYSLLGPDAVAEVAALLPDLKLVFLMRDPRERGWSQVTRGALDELGPAARQLPPAAWKARLDSPGVRRRSDYPAILRDWGGAFDGDRIFLAFFEEIGAAPRELLTRLFRFLGVRVPDAAWFRTERVAGRASATPDAIPMPAEIRRHLAADYAGLLRELHERFGGPASRWYRDARATLAGSDPPGEPAPRCAGVESALAGCARSRQSSS
jgi:hypothetical protein